jgi:hypothetical protein
MAMDYPLLAYTLLLFLGMGYIGHREYQRLVKRWPDASLTNFHRKPGWVRFVLLLLVILMAPSLYLVMNRTSLWSLPDWFELTLLWWSNGLGAALFGLLLGLAWGAWKREALPNARALVLTAILCQAGLLYMTAWMQRLIAPQLSDTKWSGKMLLQTSGSSCAPASAANVAGLLGLNYSEQDMARFMSTRAAGTSPAFIIRGLREAGITGRKFADPFVHLDTLPLPAILIVDHPGVGPESHAVAALRYDTEKKALEIWNPLTGPESKTREELKRIWSGHGIACQKTSRP